MSALAASMLCVVAAAAAPAQQQDKVLEQLGRLLDRVDRLQEEVFALRKELDSLRKPNKPSMSSVKIDNDADKEAVVVLNNESVRINGKETKLIQVPSGKLSYQVMGTHDKPVVVDIGEGSIYGLVVQAKPEPVVNNLPRPTESKVVLPIPKHAIRLPTPANTVKYLPTTPKSSNLQASPTTYGHNSMPINNLQQQTWQFAQPQYYNWEPCPRRFFFRRR